MRFLCSLLLILVLALPARAQFGFTGQYLTGDAPGWTARVGSGEPFLELPGDGWQAGVDYWFRLKNARIEFLPTLAYSRQAVPSAIFDENTDELIAQAGHFFFNVNIYPLDLRGDCDCPTWSKEGPTLEKGLFLQLSPGISYFNLTNAEGGGDGNLAANIGLGLGFDFGLSELITITPILQARYYPRVIWPAFEKGLPILFGELEAESELWQYTAGLRVGIRLDQ
ncbi:MAG: hypothetical protein KDC54_22210 [Lewinella sp.]|nr:hypothetical protein [Lewinella sp.]